nr:GIY-YIG nuclease family protein [Solimonas marina]
MLRCADGAYYAGHTDDLPRRLAEHEQGTTPGYTTMRRPVTLVFSQELPSREEALAAERQIKRWSRRKKEALIAGDWNLLKAAARKDFSCR